jgi:hypothetical protein
MLIFRSEAHVERWRSFRGLPPGGTMSTQQCWQLAKAWSGDRLSPDWRRRTPDEAEAIFAAVGLTGAFWNIRG